MGRIIPLHGDAHREAQLSLPWYVTGRLEPQEHARVAAHIAACADCQAALRAEQQLDSEVAALPLEVQQGWRKMQDRLAPAPSRRRPARGLGGWFAGGGWQGPAIVAQFAVLILLSGALLAPSLQPARYRALSSTPPPTTANLIVMFRPDTTEAAMRQMLGASHARLIDGPTTAGVYVLQTPTGDRDAALALLRSRPEVALAEPIDAGRVR